MQDDTLTSPINRRAASRAMPGVLTVVAAWQPVTRLTRAPGKIVIGRDAACTIPIPADLELSRQHATVEHLGDTRWRITDHGTKNGTYVNGVLMRGGALEHEGEPIVVRTGGSIVLLDDLSRFATAQMTTDGPYVISPRLQLAHDIITHAARAGVPVLAEGETGTGKEQLGALYRAHSKHAKGPLVILNCSTLPPNLEEATLFGARRGAYTGADTDRPGLFTEAHHGVLFLDELATLPLPTQSKLLRVLEDGIVRPVGGPERKVDVLVLAATNVDMRAAVQSGTFRQDLFMRLAREHVVLPPLRHRREEIPYLIAREGLRAYPEFTEACLLHPWPGNLRELLAAVTRAARTARAANDDVLAVDDLPPYVSLRTARPIEEEPEPALWVPPDRDKYERLRAAYEESGDAATAAEQADVSRATGYRWLKRAGLL